MTSEADSAPDIAAVDELRFLAESLRRVDAATAAAHWDDDALALVLVDARAELKSVEGAIATTLPRWLRPRRGGSAHSTTRGA
ncbi:MAG: hypothetical protein JWR78_157 [Mycobacterium sp.]|nr:hypothetical protein [Mycobacterium sp.]